MTTENAAITTDASTKHLGTVLDASAGSVLIVASSNKTTRTKTFTLMLYEVKWLYSKSSAIIRHMKLVGMTTPVAAPDSAAGQQQTSSSSSSSLTTGFFIFF